MDLFNTEACPKGHRCEYCGVESRSLRVETRKTPLGVVCLTLCPKDARSTMEPRIGVGTAGRLVEQHRKHLAGSTRNVSTC